MTYILPVLYVIVSYKTATNMNDQTLWTRLWLIEENEDNVVAVVFDLETFSMEGYTKVE